MYDAIAVGGMATVYYGRLLGPVGFSRTVAIKRLHPQFASDTEFVAMFLDEARLAARIRHPNVVATLDVVATGGEVLLVMDYVPGESLARLIRAVKAEGRLVPPGVAVAILSGALRGLSAAHDATSELGEPLGIVHRDVSPQNILVGTDGQGHVLDFGVAKAVGRSQTTRDGKLKGKLPYMAPEQLRGDVVDRRTDVFAAAAVLWEVLTARRLFGGDNEGAVVTQILGGVVPPPSTAIPAEEVDAVAAARLLDPVVQRGLSVDPDRRFASCHEMAAALEAAVAPASLTDVAAWVTRVAKDVLSSRARHIAEIESSSASPPASVRAIRNVIGAASDDATLVEGAAPGRRAPGRWILLVLLGAIALGGPLALFARHRKPAVVPPWALGSASASSAVPKPVATTLLDLPLPTSANPAALAAYEEGLRSYRDGLNDSFTPFQRAATLDPALAAAHLRIVIELFDTKGPDNQAATLDAYRHALAGRDRLSPRDWGILDALEPVLLGKPADWTATQSALQALSSQYPADVDLLGLFGEVLVDKDKVREGEEVLAHALELDPAFVPARASRGAALLADGDLAGAEQTAKACLASSPRATVCLDALFWIHSLQGDCSACEALAHRYIATSPDDAWGYIFLLDAELARREPAAALDATTSSLLSHVTPSSVRAEAAIRFAWDRAVLDGNFSLARKLLDEHEKNAALEGDVGDLLVTDRWRAELALETGDITAAGRAAKTYLQRKSALAPPSHFSSDELFRDATPWCVMVARRAEVLSATAARKAREAWIRTWEPRVATADLWINAYARPAETKQDAEEALAAAPADIRRLLTGLNLEAEAIGRTYLLAGRVDDALPFLESAAAQCDVRRFPLAIPRAGYLLGLALEAKGDKAGACRAFAAILDRWGKTRPRSVTAAHAADHARSLGCAP